MDPMETPPTLDPFADTTVATPPPLAGPAPSDAQLSFLRKLADERDFDLSEILPTLDRRSASTWIDRLKEMPKAAGTSAHVDPPEGFHIVTTGDRPMVFKVQRAVHGSGRLYAKQLLVEGGWDYVGTAPFRWLSEATVLTLEKAQEYGQLYGICCCCGATLTNEDSIRRGIGPVCGNRL